MADFSQTSERVTEDVPDALLELNELPTGATGLAALCRMQALSVDSSSQKSM